MTLEADYICNSNYSLYQAAQDVTNLLQNIYSMPTTINTIVSTDNGDGFRVTGIKPQLQK